MQYLGVFTNYLSSSDEIELNQTGKSRNLIAYYLQADYNYKKFAVTAGYRYDRYNDFGDSHNPRVGFILKPFKNLNIKMLYGQAFRAPTFKELYDRTGLSDKNGVIGNEYLKPETHKYAEIGLEFLRKIFYIKANCFYNTGSNLIDVYDHHGSAYAGTYENIGNTNIYGAEFETTIIFHKTFSMFFNASYFEKIFQWNETGNIVINDIDYLKNRGDKFMYNTPRLRLNTGLNFPLKRFNIFVGVNYGSSSKSNDRFAIEGLRFVEINPYILGNFSLAYSLTDNINIKVSANNIGKIKYSDPEQSTSINLTGKGGMGQPCNTVLIKLSCTF